MIRLVLFILAGYFFLTGLYLFFAPEMFYRLTPGLSAMGPYNFHFIRDVAFTFLVSGAALGYGTALRIQPVVIVGAAWPLLHALFHAQIWASRGFALDTIWLADTVAVIAPGLIVFLLALKLPSLSKP